MKRQKPCLWRKLKLIWKEEDGMALCRGMEEGRKEKQKKGRKRGKQ